MAINIAELVAEQARLRPASLAIIVQGKGENNDRVITYGQLIIAVGCVARHLRQQGVTPGMVAGVSMSHNPLHVITLLALAQLGAVSLPLHIALPQDRRLLTAKRFGASCVVSGRNDMALAELPFVSLAGLSFDGSSVTPDAEIYPVDLNTPFRIAISSGTSGDPKGMLLTYGLNKTRNARMEQDFSIHSRTLPMDLNFSAGFRPAFSTLARGACIVFPRSMGPDHLLHAIVRHHVSHVLLSPAQARDIAGLFVDDGLHCPSLVRLSIAGGSLAPDLLHKLRGRVTPNVYVDYGSTESGMISCATPEILEQHPRCAGKVHEWARVEIVDTEGRLLPHGETGLLRVRSEDQVPGYYRDEDQTCFRDGGFHSGDLGRMEEDGLLYIEGRADEQLNVGGQKINPEDIDAALATHPQVVEAGSFILVREQGGELLAAAVVLRDKNSIDDIRGHARVQLGPIAPAVFFVVSSLPRTITGKLRRGELSAHFSSHDRSH